MASIKKNFLYNAILTVSGYIFPLLTFPYVTRVLGAENIGIVNFALSVVDYFVLFSTLGMSIVGLREIAQSNDELKRNNVFNKLVSIHILLSLIALVIYIICVCIVPQLYEQKVLFMVGGTKIILNVFLIEWLFRGLQDFRYVTLRTIATRLLYVAAIFIFVRERNDYVSYFIVTIAQVLLNACINWKYANRYVHFHFTLKGSGAYVMPLISWGTSTVLLSFYTTFNVMYLGFISGALAVGYYTTATKLYTIILSILQAYNGVFIPYLNSLYSQGEIEKFKQTIGKSFNIVSTLSIPMVAVSYVLAPEIIDLIAGKEFVHSVLPFRIVLFQVLIIGISQITNSQILLSLRKDKEILISTIAGTATSVIILLLFVGKFAEVAAACAVTISHVVEFSFLLFYAKKNLDFKFPIIEFFKTCILSIPMIVLCILVKNEITNTFLILMLCGIFCIIYYIPILYFVKKDTMVVNYINKMLRK